MRVALVNVKVKPIRPPEPDYPVHTPLTIAFLGAVVREAGFEVALLDERIHSEQEMQAGIADADVVGISALTPSAAYVERWGAYAKGEGKTVIIGGPHCFLHPTDFLERGVCHVVVTGEAERSLVDTLRCLEDGGDLAEVQGLAFERDGEIVTTPPATLTTSLDELPFSAFDLLPMDRYFEAAPKERVFHLLASRGCPYSCSFCQTSVSGYYRRRSPENVVEEIDRLYQRYGPLTVLFVDPLFIASKSWIHRFCTGIIERRLKVKWVANSRVDTVDYELLRLAKRAGLDRILYGFESGSDRLLEQLDKRLTTDQIIACSRATRRAGVWSKASIMVGIPGERDEDVEATRRLLKKARPDVVRVHRFVALEDTEVFEELREELVEDFAESNFIYGDPGFVHDHFSPDELVGLQREMVEEYHRWRRQPYQRLRDKIGHLWWYVRNPSYLPARLANALGR
jgi:radical SAM superfamily enzyme YgiQ (UPF0313 family)